MTVLYPQGGEMREIIERGDSDGMHSFDQHLLKLYNTGMISEETAIAEADSVSSLRIAIASMKNKTTGGTALRGMSVVPDAEF